MVWDTNKVKRMIKAVPWVKSVYVTSDKHQERAWVNVVVDEYSDERHQTIEDMTSDFGYEVEVMVCSIP